jgi:L-rhamnose mutarotase
VERACFILRVRQDRLDEYKTALAGMEATDVNTRWQAAMSEFLVPPMRRIEEVFHLE